MADTVAAVVVAFNRKELLLQCIEGLLQQTFPVDAIFITDNASTDGTQEYLRARGILDHPKVHYTLLPANLGGAGGFAAGMEAAYAADHTWLWIMDDDAEPYPNALEEFLPFMAEPGTAALANLKLDTNQNPLVYHLGSIQWRSSLDLVKPLDPQYYGSGKKINIEFSSFIGLLIHRDAISKVGFPRKEFFIHCDDFEYSVRLLAAGRIYLIPSSKILHKEKLTPPSSEKHWGSATYRRVPIEKYAFEFFGIRNRIWTLLALSTESPVKRRIRIARDLFGMAARILLYERDYRGLRLKLLALGAWGALLGRFDNTIPFDVRKELTSARTRG